MADLNGFDAREVEPSVGFEPIPAGKYPVIIVESETKPTKSGTGDYLELKLQIQGGQFDGRLLFDRLNLNNPNEKAVQIARASLSAICRAVGVLTPHDSSELHNKTLIAIVKLRKREDTGDMSNEVKGYEAYGKSAPAKPTAVAAGGKPADPWA